MKNAGTVKIILLPVGGFISFLSKTLSLAPKYLNNSANQGFLKSDCCRK